jgi:hypothetical protein
MISEAVAALGLIAASSRRPGGFDAKGQAEPICAAKWTRKAALFMGLCRQAQPAARASFSVFWVGAAMFPAAIFTYVFSDDLSLRPRRHAEREAGPVGLLLADVEPRIQRSRFLSLRSFRLSAWTPRSASLIVRAAGG